MAIRLVGFILLWVSVSIFGCKEKGILDSPVMDERDYKAELKEYQALLDKDPSFNNFQTGILKISNLLVDTMFSSQKKEILLKGIEWCDKFQNENYALVFQKEYIKAFPKDSKTEQYLLKYIATLDEDKQELEVKLLYDGLLKRWPQNKTALQKWQTIKRDPKEFDYFLAETGKQMFGTPEKFAIDLPRVQQYISLSESFAYAYPLDVKTPEILMRAAQAAKTGGEAAKSIELFDWVYQIYPNSEHAPNALFLKGFTYETDLNQKDFAMDAYTLFLNKFPQHERAKEVKFLLDNIHTSNEELLKKLEN